MRDVFARIAAWCVERPVPALAGVALLVLLGAIGAFRLDADAGTDQLVDEDSEAFVATEEFKREFGDDAVVVLVKGDLEKLMLTSDLGRLLSLEGCLSGKAPGGQVFEGKPAPAPCAELSEQQPARVVYGPATFINQNAVQAGKLLDEQAKATVRAAREAAAQAIVTAREQGLSEEEQRMAADAAAQDVINQFQTQLATLAVRYGQTGVPTIDDPTFVSSVVFDTRTPGEPKSKWSYLFPSSDSALISVRLEPDLSESERREAIGLIRDAVADPAFRIRDTSYVVSGVPVVVEGLADELSSEIYVLLPAAILVMALTLALVFGPPLRLLPLVVALAAAAITFGLLAALGGALTMASLAVLPILIGLAVDYSIQFQARFGERIEAGSSPARAAVEAAASGGPVIATAALATIAGFLVLLLSPIPMVRGFGLLLVAGIAIAFCLALTVGLAGLSLAKHRTFRPPPGTKTFRPPPRLRLRGRPGQPTGRPGQPEAPPRGAGLALARARKARERSGARLAAIGRRALAAAVAAPGVVLLVALAIAVGGWTVGTQTEVISDIRELVPRSLPELQDVDELQDATGVSGELDVTVTAEDLTDPEVIAWMADYRRRVLERGGFSGEATLCRDQDASICPFPAFTDFFGDGVESAEGAQATLDLLPSYVRNSVVNSDPETGAIGDTAVLSFGIKLMPFDEQKQLIDGIRSEIDPAGTENDPPAGVSAEVVGLPVLAADANSALDGNRYVLTIAGLLAVALALLAVYRSFRRALVPLIPIVLATGWSSLGLAIAGVPLNPMSATLGALVIAIATEFSVLLSHRFEEERRSGAAVGEALRRAYSRTGVAVVASGITAIAGFAALIFTDIRMLRDFGIVTVLDLSIALLGVLIVLPAALVWAEGGFAPVKTTLGRLRGRRERPSAATS